MRYNWQQKDWTLFIHDPTRYTESALIFYEKSGQSTGLWGSLAADRQDESLISLLVKEAVKTSAIEGEMISRADVVSSIKKNLGFPVSSAPIRDRRSAGIAELLVDSRLGFAEDLDEATLFRWHSLLMQASHGITVGQWRTHNEPMQVVSGPMGFERVHFEAPASADVAGEMARFFTWFNDSKPGGAKPVQNPLIRAAIAHLYFESIHPFEDGNGRIGRVIGEKALSQNLGRPVLLSLSATIEADKKAYYHALETAQRSNACDPWIEYFAEVILKSQAEFIATVEFSLKKARFFDHHKDSLNERQHRAIQRMLEEGEDGFTGGMNVRKYLAICKVSKATATRDLQDLVARGLLLAEGEARATNYQVNLS
jgi:Fic family protein